MPEFFNHITLPQIIWFFGCFSALIVTVKQIAPLVGQLVRTNDLLKGLPKFMEETRESRDQQNEMLERLRAQVENNHDENLRDEITSIAIAVRNLSKKEKI